MQLDIITARWLFNYTLLHQSSQHTKSSNIIKTNKPSFTYGYGYDCAVFLMNLPSTPHSAHVHEKSEFQKELNPLLMKIEYLLISEHCSLKYPSFNKII